MRSHWRNVVLLKEGTVPLLVLWVPIMLASCSP
jgi:hypothetical protein